MPLDDIVVKNQISLIWNFNQKTPYLDSYKKKPFVILEKLILTCILSLGGRYWQKILISHFDLWSNGSFD
jgi:hypothetical protein